MKAPPLTVLLLAVLLCLAPCARVCVTARAGVAAGPAAAEADDTAVTLEGRREALRKLEESAGLLLSAGEKLEAARVLNRAGRLRLTLNTPQEAVDSHRKALDLLKEIPAPEVEVDAWNGLGAAYMHLNEIGKAEGVLNTALSLSQQAGYLRGQAEALLTLSDRQNFDDHKAALQTAQKALELWKTLGDKRGLARAHSCIGLYYLAQNLLAESTESYLRAQALWRELNNVPGQAEALIMLGFIEYRKGEWESDIRLLTQAQALLDETAEPGMMGAIASGLAEAFNESGLPENALVQYEVALRYFRQTQNPSYVTHVTWGLGVSHYLGGNYAEATARFREALAGIGADSLYAAQCYEYLGRIHSATGEHGDALRELQSALSIYTRAGNRMEEARVRGLLGQLSERQGRFEPARRFYRQALRTFTALSDRINQAAVYYALGRLELKAGRYELAEGHLLRSLEVTENIRRTATSSDLNAAFSATTYERYEKYIECLMRRHAAQPSRGLAVRAFEASELARARSISELLRATQTNLVPGLDPELARQEKSLRQSLRMKEDSRIKLLLGKDYKKGDLEALDTELARLGAEYQRITETIRASYPAYEQLTRPRAWDLRRIQEEVVADDQTLLLEYSLGEDRSYVWAVTRNGFSTYELPAQATIDAAAAKVYELLDTLPGPEEGADALTPAIRELARLVLSPVAAELNGRRIIVVADGALNYIPFQILQSPSSGEPLVAHYEVVNAPSASVVGELRQEAARRRPAQKVLAAFGDPVLTSNYAQHNGAQGGGQPAAALPQVMERWYRALRNIELKGDSFDPSVIQPLFYVKRELSNLRDLTAGGETLMATGFAATRERLLNTDLTQYAILHFATHGLLDPKRPENSVLVLSTVSPGGQAQDGFVGLQDVYALRAPVHLVVLSACRTGLGKDVRGEGLLGLTRGFMYAGASSVVASLWKVDDEATAELMKHFYANMLQKGMTPAEALRAAQNSIRQNPDWRAPYYWAAFTLQGEYRQVIKPAPVVVAASAASPAALVAGGALLPLLAGAALLRRGRRRRAAAPGRAATRR